MVGGTANLARFGDGFAGSIRPLLEALEEQVVLLKLLGEVHGRHLTVRIGVEEVPYEGSPPPRSWPPGTVRVTALGKLGVVGPTRMDYPGDDGDVRAPATSPIHPTKIPDEDDRTVSHDPYEILGVPRDADGDTIKKAYRKLARQTPPRRQPRPGDPGAVQGRHPRLRGPLRPPERRTSTSAATRSAARWGSRRRRRLLLHRHHGRLLRRPGGEPARGRGAPSARTPGPDALINLEIKLAEAAFDLLRAQGRHRGALHHLQRQRAAPGTRPVPARPARGRGETFHVQRSFLGEIRTMRLPPRAAASADHPRAVPRVLR